MAKITLQGRCHELGDGETVLEGLIRAGVSVAFSCRSGTCQTCVMRAVAGTPPPESQKGLKETRRAQGYFLPCVCRPDQDLEIAPPAEGEGAFVDATVIGKEMLGDGILRLRLRPRAPMVYRPGQFVNLRTSDGVVRSYSLASVPGVDEALEFHVRRLSDGRMSSWVHEAAQVGDTLALQGPAGECFYVAGQPDQPLLLIGTGSGLAPLWGIARDALRQGHTGPVWLYHGSRTAAGLYLTGELCDLAGAHPAFHYVPCVSGQETLPPGCRAGRAADVALSDHPQLKGWRAYLCGNPDMVTETKRRIFLAGAGFSDIHADAFKLSLPVETPVPARTEIGAV